MSLKPVSRMYNWQMNKLSSNDNSLTLIYDGECPFCTRYVTMMRLRESAGKVQLLDARTPHPLVDQLVNSGFDLDDGMVLMSGDNVYHGDSAVHALALMSGRVGWFNRLNYFIFRSERLSRLIYPILRAGRNATLRLLQRQKIHR